MQSESQKRSDKIKLKRKARKTNNIVQNTKNSNGITLIALVVTIVILIILSVISVSALFGENGLIKKAQEAKQHQANAIAMEAGQMQTLTDKYTNIITWDPTAPADTTAPTVNIEIKEVIDTRIQIQATAIDETGLAENETYKFYINGEEKEKNTTGECKFEGLTAETKYVIKVEAKDKAGNIGNAIKEVTTTKPTISTSTSYVGCYADVNEDGKVEGIIYADLAVGGNGTALGQSYNIPVETGLKNYYVSETGHNGQFGNGKDVIRVIEGSQGKNRFYVMALQDIDSNEHMWQASANINMVTSTEFGSGKTNTAAVMAQYTGDLWGQIGTQVTEGWFVPSRDEWAAFAGAFDINTGNYSNTFKFGDDYWTSSQSNTGYAWSAYLANGNLISNYYNNNNYVRLSTTF